MIRSKKLELTTSFSPSVYCVVAITVSGNLNCKTFSPPECRQWTSLQRTASSSQVRARQGLLFMVIVGCHLEQKNWICHFGSAHLKKKKKRKHIRLHHDMYITPLFACCMTLHTGAALSSSPFHSGTLHYVSNEGSPHQCVNSYNILALRIQKRHDHTYHDINQLVNQLLI